MAVTGLDSFRLDDGLTRKRVIHGLRVLDVEAITIETSHEFELEPNKATRFLQRRYNWTGTGTESRPAVDPNADEVGHTTHRLHGPVITEPDGKRLLVVDLGQTHSPAHSRRVTVKISHRFLDTGRSFNRTLSHLAYDGCEYVRLSVTLPRASWEMSAREIYQGTARPHQRTPLDGVDRVIGRAEVTEFVWEIDSPLAGVNYQLTWKPDSLE